jgi:hypothetical protein
MHAFSSHIPRPLLAVALAWTVQASALDQQTPQVPSKQGSVPNGAAAGDGKPAPPKRRVRWLPRGIERGPFLEAGVSVGPAIYSAVVSTVYASWYQRGVEVYGGKAAAGYGLGFGDLAVTTTQHYFVSQDGMADGKPQELRSVYGLGIRYYVLGWASYIEASAAMAHERLSADRDIVDTSRPVGDRWTTVRECERASVRGATLATGLNLLDAKLGNAGTLSARVEVGAAFLPFPGGSSRRSCALAGAAPATFRGADDPQLIGATNATIAWRF